MTLLSFAGCQVVAWDFGFQHEDILPGEGLGVVTDTLWPSLDTWRMPRPTVDSQKLRELKKFIPSLWTCMDIKFSQSQKHVSKDVQRGVAIGISHRRKNKKQFYTPVWMVPIPSKVMKNRVSIHVHSSKWSWPFESTNRNSPLVPRNPQIHSPCWG